MSSNALWLAYMTGGLCHLWCRIVCFPVHFLKAISCITAFELLLLNSRNCYMNQGRRFKGGGCRDIYPPLVEKGGMINAIIPPPWNSNEKYPFSHLCLEDLCFAQQLYTWYQYKWSIINLPLGQCPRIYCYYLYERRKVTVGQTK